MAANRTMTKTKTPGVYKVTRTLKGGEKSTRYQVMIRLDGKLVNEGTYDSYELARSAMHRARGDLDSGTHVPLWAGATTFGTVAQAWLRKKASSSSVKPGTVEGYRAMVDGRLAGFTNVPVRKMDYDRISTFLTTLAEEGLSPSSRRNLLTVIKGVMGAAVKQQLIKTNPCHDLDRPRVRMTETYELQAVEVESLISAATKAGEVWGLLVETAAYTGLRAGELAGLRVRRVDTAAGKIQVAEAVVDVRGVLTPTTPKSTAGRRVVRELPPSLCNRLRAYISSEGLASGDYVFGWKDTDGVSHPYRHGNFYRRVWLPACKAVGLPVTEKGDDGSERGVRFHDLRHFHAANLLADPTTTLKDAQAQMGHTSLALLADRYAHLLNGSGNGRAERVEAARRKAQEEAAKPTADVIPFPTHNTG